MSFRGFQHQYEQNRGKKFHDIELDLKHNYAILDELSYKFIEEAKTIGSEEQLEMWIQDLVNYVYSIGYKDSQVSIIEAIGHNIGQLNIIEEVYQEQVHDEDCQCDECRFDEDEFEE